MGSSGAFLKKGGFKEYNWIETGKKYGIKVLKRKGAKLNSLPHFSNTPGTAYLKYHEDGVFSQYIEYDEKRQKSFVIDLGPHKGIKTLHAHFYSDGKPDGFSVIVDSNGTVVNSKLYNKYKKLFKGVKNERRN